MNSEVTTTDKEGEMECANPECSSVTFKIVVNATATVWNAVECTECRAKYKAEYFDNSNRFRKNAREVL